MKKLVLGGISFLMLISAITFTSCEKQSDITNANNGQPFKEVQDDSVTGDCYSSLVYMREEEKLAHDVYVNMYELWNVRVFDHISKAETVHTNAIKGLLDLYGIDDPVLSGVGQFTNSDLQALYDSLISKGSGSLKDALLVGATIEEVDIIDLDDAMEQCDNDTIDTVYSRLRHGSTHHLKAFVGWLAKMGIQYEPQYLSQEEYDEIMNSSWNGNGGCGDSTLVALTQQEKAGLLFMREEEKLAHDVYVNMYSLWGVRVFLNISKSETQHINSVLRLINLYGLEDPALPGIGEFSDETLQTLYDNLMAQGSDSLVAGLIVGTTIEEVDILDLFEQMEQTENTRLLMVYSHLEKGSEAHLRAYVAQLKFRGITYEPQYLSQDQYDAIVRN